MPNNYSEPVEKIINNYLKRLKKHLKGFPEKDQAELVKEIHSHIYESYVNDPTENEIERIFNVLDKLGEPADVISSRMSTTMVSIGKKKKLPLYILAGILIALFGLPLGIGGISILLSVFLTVCVLILTFYIIAFSLIIAGWIGLVVSIIRFINPYFLDPYVVMTPLFTDPTLNSIIYIVASILTAAIGIGFLWLGKYLLQGMKFLSYMTFEKIREARRKRRLQTRG